MNIIIGQWLWRPWISRILVLQIVQRASVSNTFTHASPVVQSLVEGHPAMYYKLAGNWFVRMLCDETSWRSSKMATIPGPFVFYSESAHQKPALVVSGPREDANPSVNDKLRS